MGVTRPSSAHPLRFLRRDQHEQVRRNRRRRTLRRRLQIVAALFLLGLLLGTAYAGRQALTHSPLFRLRRIVFLGTSHASPEELEQAVGRARGRNLFRLDLARLERDVEACRWVKHARLKRVVPDRLTCAVEERTPRALALLHGQVWLVDEDGVAIDRYGESTREYSFPILTGLDTRSDDHARAQIVRGVRALEELTATHPGLGAGISEIDLSREDRLELRFNGGGPVVRLNPDEVDLNLDRYIAMRDYLTTHFGDGAYVDLRFHDRIAFQPSPSRSE
ncbi:MAG TPA: FtsQ-type POTRA domain-containing protein [Candidatus Polarisedimenticolia bacterium]|nr:FtsQ-type POTRA domain-containing protein [Candidatus Polarisedimenticolia bacterium]